MDKLKIAEEKLGAMVRIPTVSKHEYEDLSQFYLYHQELEKLFPLIHEKLEKTVLNGTLIYHWKGADTSKLPVLFMGHQDVVPASDEGWSVPAYSGVVKEDGCLYGRGTLDCKGTMYVQLQAVEDPTKRAELFDELMFEYSEDSGLAIFPEGYTFTYDEMYDSFEEAAFALEEYEISDIVESEAGYHIIMRVPTHRDSVVNLDYETYTYYTVLAYAATEVYSQKLRGWMDDCEVVWAEGFENLTAEQIFG